MCPDDCPEGETCTVTGLPRVPLYDELELLKSPDWTTLIQRSFQILTGSWRISFSGSEKPGGEDKAWPQFDRDCLQVSRDRHGREKFFVNQKCGAGTGVALYSCECQR